MTTTSLCPNCSDSGLTESVSAAVTPPAGAAQRAVGGVAAAEGVPFSNTGQKVQENTSIDSTENHSELKSFSGFEFDSEWIELFRGNGKKLAMRRHPLPHSGALANAALVDWLAFTVRPPEGESHEWVIRQLQRLNLVGVIEEMRGGYAGYTNKAQYQDAKIRLCLIAWGGKNQAGTVYVSFPGHGCARISDWAAVSAWLEKHGATITRLDLAYDDFKGEAVTISRAVEWYVDGGFGSGGRMPSHRLHGDWLLGDQSRAGRTLEIGSREGGKLTRVYEKGKQLGDPTSPWVRIEVEWHNEARKIPYVALTEPGRYLAGAYECLHFLDKEQSRIETTQRAAKVSFDKAMMNGRQLTGKLLNLALDVFEGDYGEVVERLRRDGYPARVEPYSYAIKGTPEVLATSD